jgi:4-aminobutyrate aminotransferase-like enzyme
MVNSNRSRLLSTRLTTGSAAVPTIVGGEGVWLRLEDGRQVLDASNTAAPLGHKHPEMVESLCAASVAPVVNEGWGWPDRELAAEDLIRTSFGGEDWVGAVRFFISASEANDAALSLAQAITGRQNLITRERAYHGLVGLAREMTIQPQWHGGLSSATGGVFPVPRLVDVTALPAPVVCNRDAASSELDDGERSLRNMKVLFAKSAAVILDYSQGGIYHSPNYQDQVAQLAREAGTLWIADETVTGFGRVGGWYQFQQGTSRPDMVTMGKSLAAGAAPAGAVVISKELLDQMSGSSWQNYSTFRGHPAAMAAVRTHLRVSERDAIFERSIDLEAVMRDELSRLANRHPGVARFNGRGLHWTVELHGPDWREWRGEEAEPLASRVVLRALEAGVLIATSSEQTSLFLAPPLIVERTDLTTMFEALDHGLQVADEDYVNNGGKQ